LGQVGGQVGDQVWDQVGDQVWDQVRDQVRDQVGRAGYGQHDANWLGFYAAFAEFGIGAADRLSGMTRAARASGWWWPFRDACILTERPIELHRDERGRLHSIGGLALAYPDGWGIYAVHGVRVTEAIAKGEFGIREIQEQANSEVRRVMIDVYERDDRGRYLRDAGAKVLHSDVDQYGHPRRLLRMEIPDDEPYVAVEVTDSTPQPNGVHKTYTLRVPPDLRPMLGDGKFGTAQEMTCHNAVACTWGKYGHEYRPQVET
jgi:hypothetical protein